MLYLYSFSGSAGSGVLGGGFVVPRGVVNRFAEGFPGMAAMMNPISIPALTILDVVYPESPVSTDVDVVILN